MRFAWAALPLVVSALFATVQAAAPTNSTWTVRAKEAITVLNRNWYSTILRQWLKNDGHSALGVWHTWNGLEMLIDFANYTTDGAFDDVVQSISSNSPLHTSTLNNPYTDDHLWMGIALIKVYRRNPSPFLLDGAKQVFDQAVTMWDTVCNGGVYWSRAKDYKNAITNQLFLVMATQLYDVTKSQVYLNWAISEYNWLMASGMLNSDSLFNDGLTMDQCMNNGQNTWTYNQGVILGGLVNLARAVPENASEYFRLADAITRATIAKLTINSPEGKPILYEARVDGEDGEQFKGIFMRYLGQLALATPRPQDAQYYAQFLLDNADYVWNNARDDASQIYAVWIGQRHDPPWRDAIAQMSGSDLLNAAITAETVMRR